MSSLDFMQLCRLCLVKDGVSMSIFDGEGDVRQIFLKIASCLPVKVAREDKLPKKICDDCVYKVELLYQFWNTTLNADKQLRQWMGELNPEDKQGYVSDVLNTSAMKEVQATENRLDGNVIQHGGEHQNNMAMGMIDNMGLSIPIIMSNANQQQQITSVPMDTSGSSVQTVQALPGPSSQAAHNQISQNQTGTQHEDEDDTEDDENSDEECDGDDGLTVKEESEEEHNNRTVEPTTFVNVPLACDEAGPSGLQQQKISEIPEMSMPQSTDEDPKSEERASETKITVGLDSSGGLIGGKDFMPMQLLQHVDSRGKLRYSLMPADDTKQPEDLSNICLVSVKSEDLSDSDLNDLPAEDLNTKIAFHDCDKCGLKFPTGRMLNRHAMSHKMTSLLRKKLANKNQAKSKIKKTVKHAKSVAKQKYACKSCDFSSSKKTALTIHTKKEHKSVKEDSKRSSCIVCDQKFENQSSLSAHMEKHRSRKTAYFSCRICNFVCKRSTTLVSHVVQNHQRVDASREESSPKRKCKTTKSTEEDSPKKELAKETCSQDLNKDESVILSTTEECKIEPTPRKKQANKEPVERQCNVCDFKCLKRSTLYSHKQKHLDVPPVYLCNECPYNSNKKSSLYSHIQRKHKEPKYSTPDGQPPLYYCNQCDYKNKNKYELKVHVARKHTDDFKFNCETCGKKFKVKGDLTNHVRFSHKEQPVICDVCGKTCLNSNSLYVHQKFAHYKAKYECQICKRRMVTQENLNEHMIRQHEKRENVVCEECGKTFSRNSRLKVHMRVHTGDRPHSCTVCNKSFARRTALKQHLLIHTGIRPYVCDICGKAFTQKPGLISHRKSHPGSHPPLPRVLIDHILNDVMNN